MTICIDLTSKRSKTLSYVAKHSKQRKTTKVIKIQLLASIRRRKDKKCRVKSQNIKTTPNYESDQIIMNCIDLTSKRSKMLSYVAKHSKQRKTTKVIKIQLLASIRRRKDKECRVKSQNIQNNAKLQKWSYNDEFASISCQNDQNNSKLQKRSNYNELHRFDVITIKNVELRRNAFKTTQNYKSDHITKNLHRFHVKTIKTTQNYKNDQITMNCIDLTS